VLDLASGEGFGSAILAGSASSVVGVDIDERSIEHSRLNYESENVSFEAGDARDLSLFEAGSFGAVVAFEMIEHVEDQGRTLDEARRVLEPGGVLIVSTPDREAYNEVTPDNPFHARELDRGEFSALLEARFARVAMFGQRAITGSALAALDRAAPSPPQRLFVELGDDVWWMGPSFSPMYLVAVASNDELPRPPSDSILADPGLALVSTTEARRAALQAQLSEKISELVIAERDLSEATQNQERMLAELAHWRTLSERHEHERDHLAAELSRRSVRAALRVANALRRG
jgi:hypothetical protein